MRLGLQSFLKNSVKAVAPGIPKYSAATAATTVDTTSAESVGVGEARPPEIAKCSATTTVSVVAPTVASVGAGVFW